MVEVTPADTKPDVAENGAPPPPSLTPMEDVKAETAVGKDPVTPPDETTASSGAVETKPTADESAPPVKAAPRQSEEGEKHDWEVVNASPSHSPSKDRENDGARPKREREKSSNSTFGKDGKIGQKIDGVKKVLKSGVFGGVSSPKAPAAVRHGKTITKPPVPSARASLAATKPAPVAATRPRAGSSTTAKAPTSSVKLASSTTKPAAGSTVPKPTATTASIKSKAAATTTTKPRPDSPLPGAKTSSAAPPKAGAAPRPSGVGVLRSSTTGSLVRSRATGAGDTATKAGASTTGPQSRRGSVASATSDASASAATTAKPRASMPVTAASKPGGKNSMLPPANTTRSVPARASVGPGTFVKKEVEDMKARIEELDKKLVDSQKELETKTSESEAKATEMAERQAKVEGLEKQLAESRSELEAKTAEAEAEKTELAERHARALDALTIELQTAGDQAKAEADRVLAELKETHKTESDTANQNHESSKSQLEERIIQLEQTVSSLREELAASQSLAIAHQSALDEANKAKSILEDQIAQLRDETEHQRKSVIGLQHESVGKDNRIEEMQAKSAELARTNGSSLKMLDELRAEISKMSSELEMVKAVPEGDPEMEQRLETLEGEKAELQSQLEELEAQLKESNARAEFASTDLKDRDATIASLKEESTKHATTIAELETQMTETQIKHDGFLLEAARMSDSRITELSDERDKANSLRNELAAEMEQERAKMKEVEAKFVNLEQERDAAAVEAKRLQEDVAKLQAELVESKAQHEEKYASAFSDARALAAKEHAKDIDILREELTKTHTELLSNHQAELDDLISAHTKSQSDTAAEHQQTVEELLAKLRVAEERVSGAEGQMNVMKRSLEEAKEDSERMKVDLETALAKSQDEGGTKEELAKALRKNAELLDELEGTKSMAEMNRSQFESLRQSSEADHEARLHEVARVSAKDMAEERQSHARMVQGLRSEIQRHRQDLEEERNEKRSLLEQVQVLHDRVSGPRAQHALQGYNTSDQGESGESSSSSEHASPGEVRRGSGSTESSGDEPDRSSSDEPLPEMVKLPEMPLSGKGPETHQSPTPAVPSAQSSASKLASLDPSPFWSDSSDSDYQSAVARESTFVAPKLTSVSTLESSLSASEDDKTPNAAMFNVELPDERLLWPAAAKPAPADE